MALDDVEWYAILSKSFDINHIMTMPFDFVIRAIKHAVERQNEQRSWEQWLTVYPHMTKENFVPFNEFYEMSKGEVDQRSTHDLLSELEGIAALMKG
jgi:hypothetical protein